MLFNFFLKNSVVYVPTVTKLETGAYMDREPVAVVPVAYTDGLRRALLEVIARGNIVMPSPPKNNWPPPVLLKYTGARSWSAFARGASTWSIKESDGDYCIVGYRTHRKGYWEEDPAQKIEFEPGTPVEGVVERMIAILQGTAGRK